MARRKRSTVEDLIDIGAQLPWWASLMLAAAAWFGLGMYAESAVAPATELPNAAGQATGKLLRALAAVFKYVVPGALLLGTLISAIKALKRVQVYDFISKSTAGAFRSKLDTISWQQFEGLVYELFHRRGYTVTATESGPDGGIDLKLRKVDVTATVQCKHWRKKKVGVNIAREQLGVVVAEGADHGYVVTSGKFTRDAEAFARNKVVTLIDGSELKKLLGLFGNDLGFKEELITAQPKVSCPTCSSAMRVRRARRGQYAGKEFWGCARFPGCRGIRPLR